jgi:signal transduction histidine kinase
LPRKEERWPTIRFGHSGRRPRHCPQGHPRFSRALRPIYLEEAGLVAALETLAHDTDRDSLRVTFEAQGEIRRLAPEVELALYRIVQEALNNAVRHARAACVGVSISFAERDVTLRVRDDGAGFVMPERVGAWSQKVTMV